MSAPTSPIPADLCLPTTDTLGESVYWSAATETVRWIDGYAPSIQEFNPVRGTHKVWSVDLPGPVGMIAGTSDPKLIILSYHQGLAIVNLEVGSKEHIADPEQGRFGIEYNDGKVDPLGQLWLATYDSAETEPRGCLWVLKHGRPARLAESGMVVINGPAFSPDGRTTYVSDSIGRRLLAFDLDGTTLTRRRVLATMTKDEGLPDGLTVDADGCIWCAHWGGARVSRFAPTGELLCVVSLPVRNVTSVAFGGSNLSTLFITTARSGLSDAELASAPHSGSLFAVKPGVTGLNPIPLQLPFGCSD